MAVSFFLIYGQKELPFMNYVDVQWQSADGLQLVGRSWEPESEPRAVVCLVHGLGEHCGCLLYTSDAADE